MNSNQNDPISQDLDKLAQAVQPDPVFVSALAEQLRHARSQAKERPMIVTSVMRRPIHLIRVAAAAALLIAISVLLLALANIERETTTSLMWLTPTPDLPLAQMPLEPITAENVDQLVKLSDYGQGSLESVAWSPSGEWIAAGGGRGVWLYEAQALQTEPRLIPTELPIKEVAFSADSRLVAGLNTDGQVFLWDHMTQQPLTRFTLPNRVISTFALTDTLLLLAYGNYGQSAGGLQLWDISDPAQPQLTWEMATDHPVTRVAMQGQQLAYKERGQDQLHLHDWVSNTEVITLPEINSDEFQSLALSHDGAWLAVALKNQLYLYDTVSGEMLKTSILDESQWYGGLITITFTPDDQQVVSYNSTIGFKVWEVATETFTFEIPINGDQLYLFNALALNPEGSHAVVIDANTTLQIWTLTGILQDSAVPFESISSVTFSPDNQHIAFVDGLNTPVIQVMDTATETRQLLKNSTGGFIGELLFSADGHYLVAHGSNTIWTWDLTTTPPTEISRHRISELHLTDIAVHTSTRGELAIAILTSNNYETEQSNLYIYNPVTDERSNYFDNFPDQVRAVFFVDDEHVMTLRNRAGNSLEGHAVLDRWHIETQQIMASVYLPGMENESRSALLSPSGTYLLYQFNPSTVGGWHVQEQYLVFTYSHEWLYGMQVRFSPDETMILTTSGDSLNFRNLETEVGYTLDGLIPATYNFTFRPDGKVLATTNRYGVIEFWGVRP